MSRRPDTSRADFRAIVAIRDRTVAVARSRSKTVLPATRSHIVWMLEDLHARFRLDLAALAVTTEYELLADAFDPLEHWDSRTGRFADDWKPRHAKKPASRRKKPAQPSREAPQQLDLGGG